MKDKLITGHVVAKHNEGSDLIDNKIVSAKIEDEKLILSKKDGSKISVNLFKIKIYKIIPNWFPYLAVALFTFIIARKNSYLSLTTINHEIIHLEQQKELLYLPFFIIYLLEFIFRLFQYKFNWNAAYRNISFEREAYSNQNDLNYLKTRKTNAWKFHIQIKN